MDKNTKENDEDDMFEVNMDNVQGSIEVDSDSDDEIKPANLSDEFEEIGFVMPEDDQPQLVDHDLPKNNQEIMENVKNLVGMLGGDSEEKKENLVEKLLDEN